MTDEQIRELVSYIAAHERVIGQRAIRRQANRVRVELGMPTVEQEAAAAFFGGVQAMREALGKVFVRMGEALAPSARPAGRGHSVGVAVMDELHGGDGGQE